MHEAVTETPRLGTINCGSHKMLARVGFEPTTLGAVKSSVATAKTTRSTVPLIFYITIFFLGEN